MRIVLASTSPRRKILLSEAGFEIVVVPPEFDEARVPPDLPPALTVALARGKVESVLARVGSGPGTGEIVLGGDTVVYHRGEYLNKPRDPADARRILGRLSGTTHEVFSGIALCHTGRREWRCGWERSLVTMKRLSPSEVEQYLASGECFDKAGAYAIQERGDRFVEKIEGSYTNVVGLPMELFRRLWEELRGEDAR